MRRTLPVWSIPFVLALAGVALFMGKLGVVLTALIGIETVAICGYLIALDRRPPGTRQPVSNLLSLYPGHLLVLMLVALLDRPAFLAGWWTLVPAATLAYDWVGRREKMSSSLRWSISAILYAILWADLFFLVERAVVLHRQITGTGEIMIAVGFGLVGALFLSLGVYRHRIAAKE